MQRDTRDEYPHIDLSLLTSSSSGASSTSSVYEHRSVASHAPSIRSYGHAPVPQSIPEDVQRVLQSWFSRERMCVRCSTWECEGYNLGQWKCAQPVDVTVEKEDGSLENIRYWVRADHVADHQPMRWNIVDETPHYPSLDKYVTPHLQEQALIKHTPSFSIVPLTKAELMAPKSTLESMAASKRYDYKTEAAIKEYLLGPRTAPMSDYFVPGHFVDIITDGRVETIRVQVQPPRKRTEAEKARLNSLTIGTTGPVRGNLRTYKGYQPYKRSGHVVPPAYDWNSTYML